MERSYRFDIYPCKRQKKKRENGLCYYWNDKYTLGHRCIKPQLFAIEDVIEEKLDKPNSDIEEEMLEVSLHAI